MRRHTRLVASFLAAGSLAIVATASAAAGADRVIVPKYERTVLPNGITLVTMPREDVPLVAFVALVRGGKVAEPADRAGVASITAGLLEKGAGQRNAFEFADAVEGAGGSLSASAGTEAITVSGQFLAKDRGLLIGLLADALQAPRFEAAEFESLRNRQIQQLKAAKDDNPDGLVGVYGRALLFGAHPYGRPSLGSERSLAALTREDVLDYYARQMGADRLTLIFSGDIDVAALTADVKKAFANWRPAGSANTPLTPAPRIAGRKVLLVDQPGASQTYFWIGNVGVSRKFEDRAPLDVVNTLFGGRFTSILNTELRIKSGLSYGASSAFVRGSVPGEFQIRSFTKTETTAEAIDLALLTLDRLHGSPLEAAQLDSARRYVLGQFPLQFETASQWAGAIAELELYGLERAYIEDYGPQVAAVDEAAARRVIAEAFPMTADVAIVLIGDAAKIRAIAAKYGPVQEMPLSAPDFSPR